MLNDELLQAFMKSFYGYGNLSARTWFIGIEEASAGTIEDTENRLTEWNLRGRNQIEDLREYHESINVFECFRDCPKAKIQGTWRGLIRINFAGEGRDDVEVEEVRQYQKRHWGRRDGHSCLIELFPLPKPSLIAWPYRNWSRRPELNCDASYRAWILAERVNTIREMISTYKPKSVVFYGRKYQDSWQEITGIPFKNIPALRPAAEMCRSDHTTFVRISHPRYISNRYCAEIGQIIQQNLV